MRLVLLFLGAWGCCCGGGQPVETQSLIAVPGTVAEARSLHDPPNVMVTVERITRPAGGGACAAPVCLVLLPVMAWEAIFPTEVDAVEIVERSGAKVHGEFEADGDLLWAERTEDGVVSAARLLDLPELERRIVVEGARALVGPDGTPGAYQPVTIQSQVDLIGAYDEQLERREVDQGHDALLSEAYGALRVESLPLLAEWLPKVGESAARSLLLARACTEGGVQGDDLLLRKAVLSAVGPRVSHTDAGDGLVCAVRTPTLELQHVGAFATALVQSACEGGAPEIADVILEAVAEEPAVIPKLRLALDACPNADRQAVLSRLWGDPADQAVLERVVQVDEGAAMLLTPVLDARIDGDRALLLQQLDRLSLRDRALSRLELHEGWRPNDLEATVLVRTYLEFESGSLGQRDQQGVLLGMLSRHDGAAVVANGLVSGVSVRSGRDTETLAVRLVLGDRSLGPALVAAMGLATCPSGASIVGTGELAARALLWAGCTCDEVDRLHADANAAVGPDCPGK